MKKNEILKSGLTLGLCGTMFIGSTLAVFVKSVESQGNVIKTSLLDVEFNYKDGDAWQPVDGSIFKNDKLSASQSITKEIQIKNTGDLPIEFSINLFRKELKESLLDEYINVTIEKKNSDKKYNNTLKTALTPNQVELESEYLLNNNDAHEYVITFSMNQTDQPLDAEIYSDKTLDEFDIQVIANQYSVIDQLKDGYYYYNSGKPYVAFKINEAIVGENGDYILVEYFDANNKLVTSKSTKNPFWSEFLNKKDGNVVSGDNTGDKYPKRKKTDVPAGAYSTTLTSGGQNVKSIKVTVVKDGKSTSVKGGW